MDTVILIHHDCHYEYTIITITIITIIIRGGDCHGAFLPHRECVCYDRCPRCSVEFELEVDFDKASRSRPDDEVAAPLTVTSRDLHSNNASVEPAHFLSQEEQDDAQDAGIAIVKMGPGQRLKFKAIARMGISKEHAKWCPVAVATYRFWPEIHINEEACADLTLEQKMELVEICPDKILELDEITGNLKPVEGCEHMATYTEELKFAQDAMKKRPEDDDFVHTFLRFTSDASNLVLI